MGGGSKIRLTRRFPQRRHIIRSRKPALEDSAEI
jgi:hypothetical protein